VKINGKDYEIKEISNITVRPLTEEEEKEAEELRRKKKAKWFNVEPVFKKVSKREFIDFINHYPRKLDLDVYGVCEPPSITYNDFELANRWPYSIVASTMAYSDDPKDYYYTPEEERFYKIMENFEEVFNNRTGYKEE